MGKKEISVPDAFAFALRVMADSFPKGCDAAYLFGQTKDSKTSVLNKGSELYYNGYAKHVALTALGATNGYPGYDSWREGLWKLGLGDNTIVPIPVTEEPVPNTFTEAVEFVRHAKAKGWKSVVCVAPAFHLPRAFLGMVTALNAEYPELRAYACQGAPMGWNDPVTHSQGVQQGSRAELVYAEFGKLLSYENLLHPCAALEYFCDRASCHA